MTITAFQPFKFSRSFPCKNPWPCVGVRDCASIKVQDTQGFPMERKYSVPSASCSGTMGSTESVIVDDSKVRPCLASISTISTAANGAR
jgi:hypothetical protein